VVEPHLAAGGECDDGREQQRKQEFSHDVTLSGSGLVLSMRVYQGIRMKNRK
jgi:hypothetical protein